MHCKSIALISWVIIEGISLSNTNPSSVPSFMKIITHVYSILFIVYAAHGYFIFQCETIIGAFHSNNKIDRQLKLTVGKYFFKILTFYSTSGS